MAIAVRGWTLVAIGGAAVGIALSLACAKKPDALIDAASPKFHVGQTWKYRTRPGEEGSRLTVVKVESSRKTGLIVHISLRGLRVKSPRAPNGITTEANHLPMTESALEKSVTEVVPTQDPLPPYEEGYREWRRAFDSGEGGAFSVPVADAVMYMEDAINGRAVR